LGNGNFTNSVAPATVNLPRDAVAITTGGHHTCALLDDGSVDCWGAGSDGALGIGNTSDTPAPSTVTALAGRATDIAAGASNSCAIIEGGAVQCWGSNIEGQLGEDATANSASPVTVNGQIQVAEISVGATRTCVRHNDNSVDCWGEAPHGRITF
jgi:alpha-tubulin suppressor-like RCC1 family protein